MSKASRATCCLAATTAASAVLAQADVFIPLGGFYFPAGLDAGMFYYLLLRTGFAGLLMAARWIDPQATIREDDTPYTGEDTELTTVSS